jgi:lipopolysaccharide assembly outer membrane protein LptD (OstA)
LTLAACLLVPWAAARPAAAQQQSPTGFDTTKEWKIEKLEENHWKLTGQVEAWRGDIEVFADEIETFTDTHRALLRGNVTVIENDAQISADSADVNYETHLGIFHNAYGFAMVADKPKKDPMGGQEPDVYFYGVTVEKISYDRYRVHHGGFTTCLQPVPRWQITSGTATIRLDHYAILRNAIIKAKAIPVFYLPILFYPIKGDDRATGFLMPTYGTSTYAGFTLSNAFFWAIDRSQDLTLMDDYYSHRGQGMGAEYRYISGPGSNGDFRFYRMSEHASTYTDSSGDVITEPGSESYDLRGSAMQTLGAGWSARGRVYYFTDITVQQAYNTNIYDSSNQTRTYSGSVGGPVPGGFHLNTSYDRTEYFSGTTDSTTTGASPRFQFSRGERPLFGTPVYFSMNGEYVNLVWESDSGGTITSRDLTRVDFMPTIRVPFTKWQFFTVNSSVSWRETHWSRSQDPDTGEILDQGVSRRYWDFQSRITGPVVDRVWNTPKNGFAEKWKHSIEPYVTFERVTSIDNFDRIIQLEGSDYTLGGTTRVDYGVTNRLLAKRRAGGQAGRSAREVLSVAVGQTYYTNPLASQYDFNYSTSFSGQKPSSFSPVKFNVRASPTDQTNGSLQIEYDTNLHLIESITANGQVGLRDMVTVTLGYSERRLPNLLAIVPQYDNFMNGTVTAHSFTNRVGATYNYNYDIARSTMLNSRFIAYYNAQCCGFAIEYQAFSFPQNNPAFPVTSDHRWNFSFTLAGLGTFSNFFGAMGGAQSPY